MNQFNIKTINIFLKMLAKGAFAVLDIAIISVMLTQTVFNIDFHDMIKASVAISDLHLGIVIIIFMLALIFVKMTVKDIIGVLTLKRLLNDCKNASVEVNANEVSIVIGSKKNNVKSVFTKIDDVHYENYSFRIVGEGKEIYKEEDDEREYNRKTLKVELPLQMENFKFLKKELYNFTKKDTKPNYEINEND